MEESKVENLSPDLKFLSGGILVLILIGISTAGLLQIFGVLETSETEVTQSVLIEGEALDSQSDPVKIFGRDQERTKLRAGNDAFGQVGIENRAGTIAPVEFVTTEDGNYNYSMKSIKYNYILIKKYDSLIPSRSRVQVRPEEQSYLAEGGYSISSEAEAISPEPSSPELAGPTFHLSQNEQINFSKSLKDSISVNYTTGENHSYPSGQPGDVTGPGIIRVKVEEAGFKWKNEVLEEVSIYKSVNASSGEEFSLNGSSYHIYSSEGDYLTEMNRTRIETFENSLVTEFSVLTGSLDGNSGKYHIIYQGIALDDNKLIANRVEAPEKSGDKNYFVLRPESTYIFGGAIRTAVFADPDRDSHYKLKTTLSIPEFS